MTERDKVYSVLVRELGTTPDVLYNTRDFFDKLNHVVHYYLERFGPYATHEKRRKLAKLSLEADKIYIELEALMYELANIEAEIKASKKIRKKYSVPEEKKKFLRMRTEEIKKDVDVLLNHLDQTIKELIQVVDKEGIA